MNLYETLWIKIEQLNKQLQNELYEKLIKPVFLYNSSTSRLAENDELKLDTVYKKQLRRVTGKRYPNEISNAELYENRKTYPISLQITELISQKFGNVLRLYQNTPSYTSVILLFKILSRSL